MHLTLDIRYLQLVKRIARPAGPGIPCKQRCNSLMGSFSRLLRYRRCSRMIQSSFVIAEICSALVITDFDPVKILATNIFQEQESIDARNIISCRAANRNLKATCSHELWIFSCYTHSTIFFSRFLNFLNFIKTKKNSSFDGPFLNGF